MISDLTVLCWALGKFQFICLVTYPEGSATRMTVAAAQNHMACVLDPAGHVYALLILLGASEAAVLSSMDGCVLHSLQVNRSGPSDRADTLNLPIVEGGIFTAPPRARAAQQQLLFGGTARS